MKLRLIVALTTLCVAVSGCASIVGGGTSQNIMVTTNPANAKCVFWRHGEQIGTINATPGSLSVKRRKYDIDIKCEKPGYEQATFHNHSGLSSMVGGNIAADLILTAGLSSIVDSANGADNEYTDNVVVTLPPISGTVPANALVVSPQN